MLILSAFFSASETALMAINRYKLRHLAEAGNKSALKTQTLLERPDRLLGLILLGNNFINISATTIATLLTLRLGGEVWLAASTALLTVVILIFAEVAPKTIAALNPQPIAFFAANIYTPLMFIFGPLITVLNYLANGVLALFGVHTDGRREEAALSREELKSVLIYGGRRLPQEQRDMLLSLMDFSEATVDEVMIPRSDIFGIDLSEDWEQVSAKVLTSPHDNIPVYHDDIQQLRGIVHGRKLLPLIEKSQFDKADFEAVIQPGYFIPENTPLMVQLQRFQSENRALGFVVDEYGDIVGLVTIDDILEEIIGNHSQHQGDDEELSLQPDGSYIADAGISIRHLGKMLGWPIQSDEAVTLAGLLLERLESLPEENTVVEIDNWQLRILEVNNNAIQSVRLTAIDPEDG